MNGNVPDFWTFAGLLIGVIGIALAIYQGFERKKLQVFSRSHAWIVYEKANNMTGIVQAASRSYRAAHGSSINPEVLSLLSKSEAFGLELLRESARQIQLSEPRFDFVALKHWESIQKIDPEHMGIFRNFVVEDVPSPKKREGGVVP